MLRQSNTYENAADYVLNMALKDDAITQGYVDSVLENFGIVPDTNEQATPLSDASGIPVGEMFRSFQTMVGEPDLHDYPFSPRVLLVEKNDTNVHMPNLLNSRKNHIPAANNSTNTITQSGSEG